MKRVALYLVSFLAIVAVAGAGLGWLAVRGSLAHLDGTQVLAGLDAPVTVERDALGVPTIRGRTRLDVARATGFVHGQERFFQMDLTRRAAAGELSALFGRKALERDRGRRIHRLRDVARRALAGFAPDERALLESYAAGVNAGLAALAVRPVEYLALRTSPLPWRAEDSVLTILAMFLRLTDEDGDYDSALGHLRTALPPAVLDFLVVDGTGWDVPLVGEAPAPAPLPSPATCDVRSAPVTARVTPALLAAADGDDAPGSNAWALGGARTGGAALVADDMHLRHGVPNVWFRARLVTGPPGGPPERDVTGVTLPGTPAVVAGSNGRVAWGFTNSNGDWTDVVALEHHPDDPSRYATAQGYREFERIEEQIEVRGEPDHPLTIRTTRWGPVPDQGAPRAVRWLAHLPEALDLGIVALETAHDVPEALAIAQRSGIPPQNLVVGDADGRVGWTIFGRIPARAGYDGRYPVPGAAHAAIWNGWQPPEAYPAVIDPPGGRIWTANARVVFGPGLAVIGQGSYVLGARAHQIHGGLAALDRADEDDMLALQLDDRALFLARWRTLALAAGATGPPDARRDHALERIEHWQGRAGVGAVGYRLVRAFRAQALARALGPLLRACGDPAAEAAFGRVREAEAPLWRLVSERPLHLLASQYRDWDALLREALDAALDDCGAGGLESCTWGESNRVTIAHPMSRVVPALARWLDMQHAPLPGDIHMPRVQKPLHGASERFAVAPGAEHQGYFHMPAGQSGHPLSPFYRAGHDAWALGEPLPFLPGPVRYRLELANGDSSRP